MTKFSRSLVAWFENTFQVLLLNFTSPTFVQDPFPAGVTFGVYHLRWILNHEMQTNFCRHVFLRLVLGFLSERGRNTHLVQVSQIRIVNDEGKEWLEHAWKFGQSKTTDCWKVISKTAPENADLRSSRKSTDVSHVIWGHLFRLHTFGHSEITANEICLWKPQHTIIKHVTLCSKDGYSDMWTHDFKF